MKWKNIRTFWKSFYGIDNFIDYYKSVCERPELYRRDLNSSNLQTYCYWLK